MVCGYVETDQLLQLFSQSTDVNECDLDLHNCHTEAFCTDDIDGFNCTCNAGYSGNGTYCESEETSILGAAPFVHFLTDADECALGVDTCDEDHADCTDTVGSYVCTCHVGFRGDGETCCTFTMYNSH